MFPPSSPVSLSLSLFVAVPACGSSQAKDQIRTAASGLCHSHGNTVSEPHLQSTLSLWQCQTLTHWGRPWIEPASSWKLCSYPTETQQELKKKKKKNCSFSFIFFLVVPSSYKSFPGQRSNLYYSSDNSGSLTHWATKELFFLLFSIPPMFFVFLSR